MTKKEFIERIRKERFKYGDQSSKELLGFANRAVKKLADELYAKETHFVLELLQNADDNKYPKDVEAIIEFDVSSYNLVVRNNEVGFDEKNVDALCDVGRSTKKGEKQEGYIGEKGIGFKSVFKISDAPQIHSNGFHFYFTTADEKNELGYVVPHWLDDIPNEFKGSGTTIVLPAKKGAKYESLFFDNVQPELLLFLRRLQSVRITTDWDKKTREVRREDKGNSVTIYSKTELKGEIEEKYEYYRIAKYIADVSSIESIDRSGFTNTEIILAFPVDAKGKPYFKDARQVFAFLPVKNCGLKFILQADLLLTSGREDIQESPWNDRILEQIPSAFVEQALPLFKSDIKLKLDFYGYLQSERLEDKFKSVLKKTFDLLSESDCVLTMDDGWSSPYKCLIGDEKIKGLISNSELSWLIDKEFVAKEIAVFNDVLEELGCEYFLIEHLIDCLKNQDWVAEHRGQDDWFRKLYAYLASRSYSDHIEDLQGLKIFPLTNGDIASARESVIYFPLSGESYGFEEQLCILKDDVLPTLGAANYERVMEFLEKINVRKAEPKFIIDDYILVEHSNNDKVVNNQYVLGHIRYIKDNLDDYMKSKAGLQPNSLGGKLKLLIKDKKTLKQASGLYLGQDYGNRNGLEQLFTQIEDINFVSSEYMADSENYQEKSSWFEFLRKIGVCDIPKLVFDRPSYRRFQLSSYSAKNVQITDISPSKDLLEIFQSEDRARKNILLKLISQNWENYYEKFSLVKIEPQFENRIQKKPQTNFLKLLRELKVPIQNSGWDELQKTYLDNLDIKGNFGEDLSFLELDLASYTSFLDATGIKYKVSLTNTLDRLKTISESDAQVSKNDISRLYKVIELKSKESPAELEDFFQRHSVIYHSKHKKHWFNASEVCWKEPQHKIISSHYPALRSEYRENETFFLEYVGVQEDLNPDQLIQVLRGLGDEDASDEEKSGAAQKIYLELAKQLRVADENQEELPDWIDSFSDENLYWTHKNELWSNDDDILINDIPIIGDLFKDCDSFAFLAVDHNYIPQLELFFKVNKLAILSKVVNKNLLPGTLKEPLISVTKNLNNRSRYIARYFYTHYYALFNRLIENGRLLELFSAEIFKVEKLILQLRLKDQETKAPFNCAVIKSSILVDAVICNNLERLNFEVANEIAKTFEEPSAASFINQILNTNNQEIISLMVGELKQLPSEIEDILAGKSDADNGFFENEVEIDATNIQELKPNNDFNVDTLGSSDVGLDEGINTPAEHTDLGEDIENHTKKSSQIINDEVVVLDHTEEISEELPTLTTTELNSPIVQHDMTELEDSDSIENIDNEDSFDTTNPIDINSEPRINDGNTESINGTEKRQDGNRIKGTITLKDNKKRQGQGLSYVGNERSKQEPNDNDRSERNMKISKAAVSFVIKEEESEGFTPVEQDHNNPGYDIHSTKGNEERFIEIKGTDGPWTEYGVSLSPTQVQFAKVNKEKCWFYIVEYATGPKPKLYKIQNPFEKITYFRFDNGWKAFAETSVDNVSKVPKVGLRINLKNLNVSGTITKVNKPGTMLCKIWIELENGVTLDKVYNPSEMSLE